MALNIAESPLSIIIFFLTLGISLWGLFQNPSIIERNLLRPTDISDGNNYKTLITSGFIHGSVPHLLFNSIAFYFFAIPIEPIIGTLNFAIIYFGSKLISSFVTVIQNKNDPDYAALGASGAIAGMVFTYILIAPLSKIYFILIPVGIPAFIFGPLYLLLEYYSSRYETGINHTAHIYGALGGMVLAVILVDNIISHFITQIANFF